MNYWIIISPIVTVLSLLLTIFWNFKKTRKQETTDLINKTKEDAKLDNRLNALENSHISNERRISALEERVNNILDRWFTQGFKH